MLLKIFLVFIGAFFIMLGLWGGAYLVSVFPKGSGYNFPAFASAFIISAIGFFIIVFSFKPKGN